MLVEEKEGSKVCLEQLVPFIDVWKTGDGIVWK